MKPLTLLILFILLATSSYATVYKWVDENGSVHFSDKPYSKDAKEIKIQGTGITFEKTEERIKQEQLEKEKKKQQEQTRKPLAPPRQDTPEQQENIITEADYRIKANVAKLGADIIRISGRISSGPRCKDMIITATAINDNGLSATITAQAKKSNSHGSVTFSENAKVSGSADDFGFWNVDTVTIRCNDE